MHSVNVVFLLGEAALNCLVSCSETPDLVKLAFYSLRFHLYHDLSYGLKFMLHEFISAVSLVSNCIFLLLDNSVRHFPVDFTLSFLNLVRNTSEQPLLHFPNYK